MCSNRGSCIYCGATEDLSETNIGQKTVDVCGSAECNRYVEERAERERRFFD